MTMINNIPAPATSENFTIDDIHTIREWNYEKLKDATAEERACYYRESANNFQALIDTVRSEATVLAG